MKMYVFMGQYIFLMNQILLILVANFSCCSFEYLIYYIKIDKSIRAKLSFMFDFTQIYKVSRK